MPIITIFEDARFVFESKVDELLKDGCSALKSCGHDGGYWWAVLLCVPDEGTSKLPPPDPKLRSTEYKTLKRD